MKKLIVFILSVTLIGVVALRVYDFIMPRAIVYIGLQQVQALATSELSDALFESFEEHEKELARLVLQKMTFEVLDFETKSDEVISHVMITNTDMISLVKTNITTLMGYSLSDLKQTLSDVMSGGLEKASINKIVMLLEDETIKKQQLATVVEIHLIKEDLQWHPVIDQTLIYAVLGLNQAIMK